MLVEQLRALGDPVRWSIVRELRGGTRCACELAQVADVSSPLLSHHLKVLRSGRSDHGREAWTVDRLHAGRTASDRVTRGAARRCRRRRGRDGWIVRHDGDDRTPVGRRARCASSPVVARPLPAGVDRRRDAARVAAGCRDPAARRLARHRQDRHGLAADRDRAAADDVSGAGEGAVPATRRGDERPSIDDRSRWCSTGSSARR